MVDIDDRVGALHRQDVADRRVRRVSRPVSPVFVELARGADHPQRPATLEQLVVGELAAGGRRGDLLVGEVEASPPGAVGRLTLRPRTGQQRRLAGRDRAATHLRQRGGRSPPRGVVRPGALALVECVQLERDVAAPRQGVPGQVQMPVEDDPHDVSRSGLCSDRQRSPTRVHRRGQPGEVGCGSGTISRSCCPRSTSPLADRSRPLGRRGNRHSRRDAVLR